ncbi:hypothetical protein CBR_g45841 [Chara braunii]|uniref:Uncharacterized protein n=1 Tax=Chara braunii TaxID=69332 RepID=A0A388LZE7_CHABU|nr:hypothetical protein CBR_g45841 [Chara braunii]|eukprot:GBG87687.1 hypothetical protein CBR_g45841 [Chara braunii]
MRKVAAILSARMGLLSQDSRRKTFFLKLATGITLGQLTVLLVAAVCFWAATIEARGVGHRKHGLYGESLRVRGQGREKLGSRVLDQTPYVGRNGALHAVAEGRLAKGESADERKEEMGEARSLAGTELANGDDENGYAKKVVNSDTQGRGSIMAGHWNGQVRRRVVEDGGAASDTEDGGTDNMQGNPGAAAKNETNPQSTNSEEGEPQDEARHPTVTGEGESQTQGGAAENDKDAAQAEEREKLREAGDEEPEGVVEKGEKRREEMKEEGTEEGTQGKEEEGTRGKEEEGTQGKEEEGTQAKEEENAEEENGDDEEERTEATAQEEEKEAEEERDSSLQPRRKRHQLPPLRTAASGGGRKHQVGDRTGSRRTSVGKEEEETDMDEEDVAEKKGEEATEEDEENTEEQEEEGGFREGQGDEHSMHPITRPHRRSRVRMSSSGDATDRGDGVEQQLEEESRDEGKEPGGGKEEEEEEEEKEEKEEQEPSFGSAAEERLGFGPPPSSALASEGDHEHLATSRNSAVVVNTEKVNGFSGSNHSRGMGANELVGNGEEEDSELHRVIQDDREGLGTTQHGEAKLTSDGKMVQWDSEDGGLATDKVEEGQFGTAGGEGNMDEQSEPGDEEPGNLMEPVHKTFSGLHKKTRESVLPKMGQAKDLGVKIFEQTHSSLNEGLTPLLGKNYSPIVSTLITYGMLLVPLIIAIFIIERVRAVLSIQKLLLFANAYLTAYSVTLLCLAIVIGAEPMATLQRSAWENYFLLQFLQALGYILYLMLQLTNVIMVFNSDTILAKATALIQFGAAGAVGLHYYVVVWQRAMVDKPPKITSTAYFVYALVFFVLCQMARLRNSRRDAILSSDGGDKVL